MISHQAPLFDFNRALSPHGRLMKVLLPPPMALDYKLLLIRHGQTLANQAGIFQGCLEKGRLTDLSEEGQSGAERVGQEVYALIRSGQIDLEKTVFMVSPLRRAQQTMLPLTRLAMPITLDTQTVKELHEMDFGRASLMPIKASTEKSQAIRDQFKIIAKASPAEQEIFVKEWPYQKADYSFPGGESFIDVMHRAQSILVGLNKTMYGKTIVMISHGMVLAAIDILLHRHLMIGSDEASQEEGVIMYKKMIPKNTELIQI